MGRSTRKDRRSRTDRKNNNSRRSSPDRDDDYFMHDAESNNALTSKQRRGRRRNNKNNRRHSEQKNRDNRNSKKQNSYDHFTDPFEELSLGESTFYDEQQRSRVRGNRNHNRGDKQGNENRTPKQHNHHNRPRRSSITSAINDYYNEIRHQDNDNDNTHTPNKNKHNNRSRNLSSRSSSPARLARFCTDCSTVRRANLKLRDWLSSTIQRASSVVDTWSDEVGVGRGSADEMDWQPEPVVRVLILATTATPGSSSGSLTPTPSTIGGISGGWTPPYQQQQQQHAGLGMGEVDSSGGDAAAAAHANPDTGSWGFRPGTLDPGFSMDGGGNSGGVWEVDDLTAGNAAVWNQMNYAYRYRSMMSPPETPPETPPESPPPFMTLVT
ncbi:hypothetical protein FHL15_006099 [Xylaria flabelliformis]|uniref:Uncharacterized protein n=1 Tax=Xylaria flabelliformis TaxID=2512241 RepID=A0A553HYD7_9PEZI|nr:hypothetical protein FHL15_006099 [Xylaria flabelliformis]